MDAIVEGGFVKSLDPRDDPEMYYFVLEVDVPHVSGPTTKIALPERVDVGLYRLTRLLHSADAEIAEHVAEAERLAPKRPS